jgi:hypothetical protein
MAVWVVVGVIGLGAIAAALASRRHAAEVEPTVRQFAEFRDALSQQVAGVRTDTRNARHHAARAPDARVGEPEALPDTRA